MKIIDDNTISQWLTDKSIIEAYRVIHKGLGASSINDKTLSDLLNISPSLCFALESIIQEEDQQEDALDSISLFSLLKGLFLPLSGMYSSKIESLFHIRLAPSSTSSKELVSSFLGKEIGLSLSEKIAYLMGDPFSGGVARMGQDTLLNALARIRLISIDRLRDKLPKVVDIGVLFVEDTNTIKSEPPVTAKELIVILKNLPSVGFNRKKEILSDLFLRCGKLERYFIVRLILRRLNFGYEYRTKLISDALSFLYNEPAQTIENAIALSDIFCVSRILETSGPQGLKKLVLKPLNPVSPALAGTAEVTERSKFPLWIECKYDGIRMMAHKDTNMWGRVKYAAFTRRKHNWLESVNFLEKALSYIPARSYILDGELHGTVLDWETHANRQATVYEVYRYIQGNLEPIVKLKFIVFDILYLEGRDLTNLSFLQRRKILEQLLFPLSNFQLPLPINISEGCEIGNLKDFQKWYQYFRTQGHEGAIAKKIHAKYSLGKRTDDWMKKKAEIFLDLAVTGAYWATAQRGPQVFSAYQISCQDLGKWREIGRAEGLSQENNFEIIQRIARESLLTGRTIETRTSSAIRTGVELLPSIVATVKFDDIVRDQEGVYSLRDPKIVCIRPRGDTSPEDVDSYQTITQMFMKKN